MGTRVNVRRFGIVSLLLLGLTPVPTRAAEPPEDVSFQRDVVYGKGGDVDLKLNLSRPKNPASKKLPCVVVIHGGGWMGGDRTHHDDLTWKFAQQGYVSATIGYRLAPAHRFPAQVNDVKCAVRYLRAHAEEYKKASPITHVTPDDAPMLLFQGTRDPLVPHTQTYPMLEAMTKNGVSGRVELLIGAGHGWGDPELRRTAVNSFSFFDDHLKQKKGKDESAKGR